MANVLLTTGCNLSCSYCFAQEKIAGKRKQMSMPDVEKVITFLKQSAYPLLRVMGGEPTLHSHFPEIVELALQEGMRVDVLSNGTWSERCNELFTRISPSRLLFLLNIDHPDNYSSKLWARIERNLAALAGRSGVTLSFNIFEKRPRYEYIFDLASKYGIGFVRLSFSLPVLGALNAHLRIEEYQEMTEFVIEFVRAAEAKGIHVQLDNAVPLCIFDYEQAGELLLKGVLDLNRNARCTPIVDIGPDLAVWCCFCLSKLYNRRLDEFNNLQEIQAYYQEVLDLYQDRIFPMDKCSTCRYREQWGCQGGCLTYAIVRHGEAASNAQIANVEGRKDWQRTTILGLANGVVINRYDMPKETCLLSHKGLGIATEVDASFAPLWPLLDGRHTAQEIVDGFLCDNLQPMGEQPGDQFTHNVMQESLSELLCNLLRRGFLVERLVAEELCVN